MATSTEIEGIVERILEGDADAFAEIVHRYQDGVRRAVAFTLRDAAATDDLVQQAFVDAYFHLDRYARGRDFGAWLRAIARNLVRKELRRGVREGRKFAAYRRHLLERLDGDPDIDWRLERRRRAVARCREGLSPDASRAIDLRYGEGKSFGEVAEALGRTVAAARQLLQRVRLALRKCAEERMARA
jgi:RNA polymerase sigma-70 factor (ECF subfamily)